MKFSTLKRRTLSETIGWVLATWFGSGCAPKAPGTVGSFCSLPLVAIGLLGGQSTLLITAGILFVVGWWATAVVLHTQSKHDPGFIVIDETVGQTLTFALVIGQPVSLTILLAGFLLFRFFDIVKLWPASYFDKHVCNAFGVMMDDVMAGMYAALILYGFTFII